MDPRGSGAPRRPRRLPDAAARAAAATTAPASRNPARPPYLVPVFAADVYEDAAPAAARPLHGGGGDSPSTRAAALTSSPRPPPSRSPNRLRWTAPAKGTIATTRGLSSTDPPCSSLTLWPASVTASRRARLCLITYVLGRALCQLAPRPRVARQASMLPLFLALALRGRLAPRPCTARRRWLVSPSAIAPRALPRREYAPLPTSTPAATRSPRTPRPRPCSPPSTAAVRPPLTAPRPVAPLAPFCFLFQRLQGPPIAAGLRRRADGYAASKRPRASRALDGVTIVLAPRPAPRRAPRWSPQAERRLT